MARRRHRDTDPTPVEDEDDDEREDEDDEDDETDEDSVARDFAMARLAAARASAQSTLDAIDEALILFVTPDEDERGKQRRELVDAALEASGEASRALEEAQSGLKEMSSDAMTMGEPDDD